MPEVIIEVRGGNVVGVYGHSQKARVTFVDWDNREAGDVPTSVYTVHCLPVSNMPKETINIITSSKAYHVD